MLTEQQLEERRQGIGGSDAAAIAGLSPWSTPLDVYASKVEGVRIEETPAMRWGSLLEGLVADEYSRETGNALERDERVLRHPEHDFIRALLDRRIVGHRDGPGILEIKTAGLLTDEWGESGSDKVPPWYALQVHQYLMVTGCQWAHLAALFLLERELRIYRIEADREIADYLVGIEAAFWHEHVLPKIPPDPISLADMAKRWPRDTGASITASAGAEAGVVELRQIKGEIKALEEERDEIEARIKGFMGDATMLVGLNGQPLATWKSSTTRRLDTTTLKATHPALAEQFTTEIASRRFLLKG